MDADSQVDGDLAESVRRVQVAARQVEGVSWLQHDIDQWLLGGARRDRGSMLLPRLVGQRVENHRLVNVPPLVARDLKDEYIMHVVVGGEPSVLRRRDVRIDLNWVTQV
jgi:hypothetical protein